MRITGFMLPFVALALAACSESKSEVQEQAVTRPVLATQVRYEPAVRERSFVATVRPRIESDLGFRVAGKVARRLVDVGETVKAGDVLATLDEVDLRLQLDQAEAELRAAKGSQMQAQADLKRGEALRKDGWSTDANVEKQRAATDEADGRVLRAERAVSLAQNALDQGVELGPCRFIAISRAPMLLVMISVTWRKSASRPWLSVSVAWSITWSRIANRSGCAFSISSSSSTV